ncbi:MAG: adenylate/guanylate cyclase domain-containing protein [Pirellulales bacterium]
MLHIFVQDQKGNTNIEHADGPLVLGRYPKGSATFSLVDPRVSRNHLRVTDCGSGQVQLENVSGKNPIVMSDGRIIDAESSFTAELPASLRMGSSQVHIRGAKSTSRSVGVGTLASLAPASSHEIIRKLGDSPDAQTLAHWFETLVRVQQAAAGSEKFLAETARAVVELVGLDRGLVLLLYDGEWEVAAIQGEPSEMSRLYSLSVLDQLVSQRRTYFKNVSGSSNESLVDVESVVAAPVMDERGEVIGAVYGSRSIGSKFEESCIRPLEAQLVQVMASAVSAGVARQKEQREAMKSQIQFEQFFSTTLARELQRDPNLLEGRQREVTALFSDVRKFSAISEKLGPRDVFRCMQDVMELQTSRIQSAGGVVVDYYGDGLLAMWNAPTEQSDHAERACDAALAIIDDLDKVNEQWGVKLDEPLSVGIGINTGIALVGNTGSSVKMKYGPMGPPVNAASRIAGAVKQLGVPVVVSDMTREKLGDQFATRRLCRGRLIGINQPLDLFELYGRDPSEDWCKFRDTYERALELYESQEWEQTTQTVNQLLTDTEHRFDAASLNLLAQAVECLRSPPAEFDPIVHFTEK